jgi:hypothetical protein
MTEINLPDFSDLQNASDRIVALTYQESMLKLDIDIIKAGIIGVVMSDPQYLVGGKVPSMDYIKNTYLVTGLDDKLPAKLRELYDIQRQLDSAKSELDFLRRTIDIWRTKQYNERQTLI